MTVNGRTHRPKIAAGAKIVDERRHPPHRPSRLRTRRASWCCTAICSDSAIMKTSVISEDSARAICAIPHDPIAFEGRAMVFDGPEDYHARIDDPALGIDEHTMLFMRGAGPSVIPGGAEVVNMRPPDYLIKKRHPHAARASATDASRAPQDRRRSSMRRRKPRSAAVSRSQDRRPHPHRSRRGTADMLVSDAELAERRRALEAAGGYRYPASQPRGRKFSAVSSTS